MLTELHVLLPISEVRVQPSDGSAANTKVGLEPLKQHVKRRRYVETDQHRGLLVVSSSVDTVHDMQQRILGGMSPTSSGQTPMLSA